MNNRRAGSADLWEKCRVSGQSLQVLVVDRGGALTEALVRLLELAGITAAREQASEIEMAVMRHQPAILLLESAAGWECLVMCAEVARRNCKTVRVLLLGSGDERDEALATALGAAAIVSEWTTAEELIAELSGTRKKSAVRRHVGLAAGPRRPPDALGGLTDREIEVLCVLMVGASNAQVAEELAISPHTVRTHVQNILAKLGVQTRLEAAVIGFREGLRPLGDARACHAGVTITGETPIRLLIAEERELHRAAMSAAFEVEADLEVMAQVGDGTRAIDEARRLKPDVLLIEPGLLNQSGLAVCEEVKAERPLQRVLVVDDGPNLDVLLAALWAGADGYVTKEQPLAMVIDAVRRVRTGEVVVPPSMHSRLLREVIARDRQNHRAYEIFLRLTKREKQILTLLVEGCGNSEIAEILVISPGTVRTHIHNVVRKVGAHSRLEAAALATQHGWLRCNRQR